MEMAQENETPIPQLQLHASEDTDMCQASGNEHRIKVSYRRRKREAPTVAGERSNEEESQGSSQGRARKQQQVTSSDIVVISLEEDSVEGP